MNLGKKIKKERKRKRKEATEPPGAEPWEEGGSGGLCSRPRVHAQGHQRKVLASANLRDKGPWVWTC